MARVYICTRRVYRSDLQLKKKIRQNVPMTDQYLPTICCSEQPKLKLPYVHAEYCRHVM